MEPLALFGGLAATAAAVHDRDVNAARNILALWYERHAGGIPFQVV